MVCPLEETAEEVRARRYHGEWALEQPRQGANARAYIVAPLMGDLVIGFDSGEDGIHRRDVGVGKGILGGRVRCHSELL